MFELLFHYMVIGVKFSMGATHKHHTFFRAQFDHPLGEQ